MAAAAVDSPVESLGVTFVASLMAVDMLVVASVAFTSALDTLSAPKEESENMEGDCCW